MSFYKGAAERPRALWARRVHGHAGGVRVQKVHRVLPAFSGRVQRVIVAPCGRIIKMVRRRTPCLHGVGFITPL